MRIPFRLMENLLGLLRHRYLIGQFVRRDLVLRYRGSILGIGWSFLYPLLLLGAFTLIFNGVFDSRWGQSGKVSGLDLALLIYCGLAVFSPLSEVLTTTPRLLLNNQNFVKKIIFPTEILPAVAVLSASAHALVHVILLLLATLFLGSFQPLALLAPLALLPALFFIAGIAWVFTAAGAYVRDLAHGAPVLAQLCMFVLPVFYPGSAAPAAIRSLNAINPLAISIEALRQVTLLGEMPDLDAWLTALLIGFLCAISSLTFFIWCRQEFADAL